MDDLAGYRFQAAATRKSDAARFRFRLAEPESCFIIRDQARLVELLTPRFGDLPPGPRRQPESSLLADDPGVPLEIGRTPGFCRDRHRANKTGRPGSISAIGPYF